MSIARKVFEECMKKDCPSNALSECGKEQSRDQDWENETTTYHFEDGSSIEDCYPYLTVKEL